MRKTFLAFSATASVCILSGYFNVKLYSENQALKVLVATNETPALRAKLSAAQKEIASLTKRLTAEEEHHHSQPISNSVGNKADTGKAQERANGPSVDTFKAGARALTTQSYGEFVKYSSLSAQKLKQLLPLLQAKTEAVGDAMSAARTVAARDQFNSATIVMEAAKRASEPVEDQIKTVLGDDYQTFSKYQEQWASVNTVREIAQNLEISGLQLTTDQRETLLSIIKQPQAQTIMGKLGVMPSNVQTSITSEHVHELEVAGMPANIVQAARDVLAAQRVRVSKK